MDSDDDYVPPHLVILTVDEMMLKGLSLLGWKKERLDKRETNTNVEQCVGMYGAKPAVVAQICEDLQTTRVKKARVEKMNVDKLHWALHFMCRHGRNVPTQLEWNVGAMSTKFVI